MSRSRMKRALVVDRAGKRFGKRWANRRVRRTPDVPNGKAYRKFYESYDICDFVYPAELAYGEDKAYRRTMK